jgi:hypothetical protein
VKERRKHVRSSLEIPLDMKGPGERQKGFSAKTINLSAGGFYCKIPFHMPILTKLRISMMVPVRDSSGREHDHAISCGGTVVRTVPAKPAPDVKRYEIACFFTDMDAQDRLVIEEYLLAKKSGR